MPGSYAHITLVNEASEKRRLRLIKGFPREAIDAANLHPNFLELGCISPDYPYLDLSSGDSKQWADAMHYMHTCQTIYVGADLIRKLPQGIVKDKCLAWFMGYTAHVITDMSIHPVVELKVGPYEKAPTEHRRCEMHQDAYIFQRLGTGIPNIANHISATILTCHADNDPTRLDPDIKNLWEELLRIVHPDAFKDEPPETDKWHKRCYSVLEKLLPTAGRLIGFARHACNDLGFLYPSPDEIENNNYIENLLVPSSAGQERRMHYDDIFNMAIKNVQQVWLDVTQSIFNQGEFIAFRNQEWDLDTGRNKADENNNLVFWEVA